MAWQWDRISKLENLLDPETWIVMTAIQRIEEKIDDFIKNSDNKFVLRSEFNAGTKVIWFISTAMWVIAMVIAFSK